MIGQNAPLCPTPLHLLQRSGLLTTRFDLILLVLGRPGDHWSTGGCTRNGEESVCTGMSAVGSGFIDSKYSNRNVSVVKYLEQ